MISASSPHQGHPPPPPAALAAPAAPHVLDYSQLSSLRQLTPTTYHALWLHTPVHVEVCTTPAQTCAARSMAGLRHPNVEFLLGTTRTPVAAVTEHSPSAEPLAALLSRRPLPAQDALAITLDLARGLLYLHVKTAEPHGAVNADAVTVDPVRRRAVLRMLARPPPGPGGLDADSRDLLALLGGMLGGSATPLRRTAGGHGLADLVDAVLSSPPAETVRVPTMNDMIRLVQRAAACEAPDAGEPAR